MEKSKIQIYSFDIFTEAEHSNLQNLYIQTWHPISSIYFNYQLLGKF